jgi:hypothetical protein
VDGGGEAEEGGGEVLGEAAGGAVRVESRVTGEDGGGAEGRRRTPEKLSKGGRERWTGVWRRPTRAAAAPWGRWGEGHAASETDAREALLLVLGGAVEGGLSLHTKTTAHLIRGKRTEKTKKSCHSFLLPPK